MAMGLSLRLRAGRRGLVLRGLAALALLLALVAFLQLLVAPLDEERARTEIRAYLERMLTADQLAELETTGRAAPDSAMARRWQAERERLNRLELAEVSVRRFVLSPPLIASPLYVARVVACDPDGGSRVRCFSLHAESRVSDFFWVNERPRWLWWLSV
jgi:hypothetical protein